VYDATLHRLRVFTAVVERGGMGAAAKALGITQPSVSAHVRALETLTGHWLLERRPGQRVQVTEAGRILYEYARDVVVGAEDVRRFFRELTDGTSGSVSVACSGGLASFLLPPVLAEFISRWPRVFVSVHTGTLSDALQLLRTGAATIGVLRSLGEIEGMRSRCLRRDELLLVAAPDHPLARRPAVLPADLVRQPFVTGLQSSAFYRMMYRLLEEVGISGYRVVLELEDPQAIKAVVGCGVGIAPLLRSAAHRELARGELVALRVARPFPSMEIRVAHLPRKRLAAAERHLVELLEERLAD
jgi:molybdate transport repressor ModE-like protein